MIVLVIMIMKAVMWLEAVAKADRLSILSLTSYHLLIVIVILCHLDYRLSQFSFAIITLLE